MTRTLGGLAVLASLVPALPGPVAAETIFAVYLGENSESYLARFDSSTPGTIDAVVPIIAGSEDPILPIRGLDFRPATGQLYGFGTYPCLVTCAGQPWGLYVINPHTGLTTVVGAGGLPEVTLAGFDFNPATDEARLIPDCTGNYRLDPTNAALTQDAPLHPGAPCVTGLAYDRDVAGTPATTAYAIDHLTDALVRIGGVDGIPSPDGGELTPIGPLGVAVSSVGGFDIAESGVAYAILRSPPPGDAPAGTVASRLYTVDLATGAATPVGEVGPSIDPTAMTVGEGFGSSAVEIPTLGPWGALALAAALAGAGLSLRRRAAGCPGSPTIARRREDWRR